MYSDILPVLLLGQLTLTDRLIVTSVVIRQFCVFVIMTVFIIIVVVVVVVEKDEIKVTLSHQGHCRGI